jgi:hypothetical protein
MENITSPFIKSRCIISAEVIPVEVFVIFVQYNQSEFTVYQVVKLLDKTHRIRLDDKSMRRICNKLVDAGKLKKECRPNRNLQLTNYYKFEKFN